MNFRDEGAGIKVLPIVYVILFSAMMYVSSKLFTGYAYTLDYVWMLSAVMFVSGVVIIAISGLQFRKSSTTVNPLTPEKTSSLVVTGLYAYSRNPMYVGFFLFLLSFGILLENFVALVFLPLFIMVINRVQIRPEEKTLEMIFGDEYRRYMESVRRWI